MGLHYSGFGMLMLEIVGAVGFRVLTFYVAVSGSSIFRIKALECGTRPRRGFQARGVDQVKGFSVQEPVLGSKVETVGP